MAKFEMCELKLLLKEFCLLGTPEGSSLLKRIFSGDLNYNQAHRKIMDLYDRTYL